MQTKQASGFDKLIRILTAPPLMAAVALVLLYALVPATYGGARNFWLALLFLVTLPLLAYPLQPLVPGFRGKGREGQRSIAMVMSVLGYLGGIISAGVLRVPAALWVIYLTYLVSGLGILLLNKLLHIKASGHACGIAGPVTYLSWYVGPVALVGSLVLLVAGISSVRLGRHTLSQLVWGSLVSVAAFFTSMLVAQPLLA